MFFADLVIAFKVFRERFSSKVTLHAQDRGRRRVHQRPVPLSEQSLAVRADADGGCIVDFYVDFEFKSKLLQNLIGLLFNEAVRRMVAAFETRAQQLYPPVVASRDEPHLAERPAIG